MERLAERTPVSVNRSFAFVDLSGFTAYVDERGAAAASKVLTDARSVIRVVTSAHGVRVDKWLGDGAMLVGTVTNRLLAAVLEMVATVSGPLSLRAGVAEGPVAVFEGDDYIGSPINLASKLCHEAEPGQVLMPSELARAHEATVRVVDEGLRRIRGLQGPVLVAEVDEAVLPEAEGRRSA